MSTATLAPIKDKHSAPAHVSRLRIHPGLGGGSLHLRELWEYRELLYFLIWRDVKVRYKQTALGASWAILQPLLAMAVFSLFFGRLARIPSDGIPYPLFAYCGLVPWMFFANGLTQSSNSLVASSNLITKVYFPRFAIPVASVAAGLVDLLLAGVVLAGMIVFHRAHITPRALLLPLFILLALTASLGVGLWLSALNVRYRDVRYVVPFLTQFWMIATPIAYPSNLLPEPWRSLYGLNPMAGVVEGFRWALFGGVRSGALFAVSTATAIVLAVTGLIYFRKTETSFADIV
ncbi:MAG: ABC transporter permease [Acidobacteriia bacterium]|nr:ABC transporter permease [Terriglobia bacterium]